MQELHHSAFRILYPSKREKFILMQNILKFMHMKKLQKVHGKCVLQKNYSWILQKLYLSKLLF